MALLYTWYPQSDGTLTRRGRDEVIIAPPIDNFVLGVTQPTEANSGAGILRAYPTTVVNGNVTVSSGQVLADTIINGFVTLTGTGKIENCVVRGPATTYVMSGDGGSYLINSSNATWTTNPNISFCTIDPQSPSPFLNGIGQRNYYSYRSVIKRCTDNLTVAGDSANNYRAHTSVEGSFLGDLIYWVPDIAVTSTYPGGRPEGTHNEGVQFHGNGYVAGIADSYWYGNTMGGDTDTVFSGTCTKAGVGTATADPSSLTRNQSNGVTLSTPGTSQVNGHFEKNWFVGGYYSFNGGGGAGGTMKVVDNLFERRNTGSGFQVLKELVINTNYTRIVTPANHYIDNPNGVETVPIGNS